MSALSTRLRTPPESSLATTSNFPAYQPFHRPGSNADLPRSLWAAERRQRRIVIEANSAAMTEQERRTEAVHARTIGDADGGPSDEHGKEQPVTTWLSEAELRDAEAACWFARQHGVGSVFEATQWYAEHSLGARQAPDVARCVEEYLEARRLEGVQKATLNGYRNDLRDFVKRFGDRPPIAVEPSDIRAVLLDCATAATRYTRWKRLSSFFRWSIALGYVFENPVLSAMRAPRVRRVDKIVLTPEDARAILNTATSDGTAGFWGLALFSGIRTKEIERVQRLPDPWSVVRWGAGVIDLPAAVTKSGARWMPLNPTLRQWLKWIERQGLEFFPKCFWHRTTSVRRRIWAERIGKRDSVGASWRSQVSRVSNAARRSYISYRLALPGVSYLQVSAEVGSFETVLRKNYQYAVSRAEAEAYFALTPDRV